MSSTTQARGKYVLWYYEPSIPAAAVALSVFAILSAAHFYLVVRKRRWFCIPLVVGGIFEVIGYAARIWANGRTLVVFPYALQTTAILLAPILFAASGYMLLGRIMVAANGQRYSFLRPSWVTAIFVGGDITSFVIQCSGAGVMTAIKTADGLKTGENIVLGGLIFQIAIFVVFVALEFVWHRRMNAASAVSGLNETFNWRKLIWSLYGFSALILIRNIVRCAEYGMGNSGYLLAHEWVIYVFDAIPMAVVLALSLMWYGFEARGVPSPSMDQESGSDVEPKA